MSLNQYVVLFFCCLDNQSRLKPVVWCMKCANFIRKSDLRHFNTLQRIKPKRIRIMTSVEVYTSPLCGFCHAAKRLLKQKGILFSEFDVLQNPSRKAEMVLRANGRQTVPQIFIGEKHVGGCDDLFALEHAGELNSLLAA